MLEGYAEQPQGVRSLGFGVSTASTLSRSRRRLGIVGGRH